MIIDSHSHLNHASFIKNVDQYLAEAAQVGVNAFLCVGWDLKSSLEAVEIASKYSNVYAAVGVHPSDVKTMKPDDLSAIEGLINNPRVVAIGEIGLDFAYEKDHAEQAKQVEYFIKFIDLANKYNKPICVHSRDAIDLTYQTLKAHPVKRGGVMHCYAGGRDYVARYVEMGFYFGVGGTVTFKNAPNVKAAVSVMPLERILAESDAPYLTPEPYRGRPNHSKFIPFTIEEVAKIHQTSVENVTKKTTENFVKLFGVEHF
ncbi:MAG: TatD family hydrolase [Bacilli bacterium]|nr:TatD family hydrolase [Bacilli bacterium]